MTRPVLTHRGALAAHRTRAKPDAIFLHALVRTEIQERLNEVNRTFKKIGIVTGHLDFWQTAFPDAQVVADHDHLTLQPKTYDLVIHAMALHWADDPVGQLVQCRHALVEDGLLLTASFGGQTLQELRSVLAQAETNLRGGLSPRVAPMGELRDLGSLLQRAGFALPVADHFIQIVEYKDLYALMKDLRAMGETNALAARDPKPVPARMFEDAARIYAETFATNEGRIQATFDLVFLTGWAPSDHQPKPLRPGSATTRLADALGGTEFDLAEKPVNDAHRSGKTE